MADADTIEVAELSDRFDTTFLVTIAAFVVALGILGFGARRLVLRRGIGEMKAGRERT